MYRLIPLLLLCASLSSHEIMVSYFDKGRYAENNIQLEAFPKKIQTKDLDSAIYVALSYPLNPDPAIIALHAASSVARFDLVDDELYAYSTYLSARFSPFSLFLASPFIEVSLAGPTYLSKEEIGDINFGSKVVYQNYVAVGFKLAAFVFDVRMINYSESLPSAFTKESTTIPLIISAGCSY